MNTHVFLALVPLLICTAFATSLLVDKARHSQRKDWGRYLAVCILGIAFGLLFIFKYWR